MTKSRLEAFSDGVLAIIITIMVLELPRPEGHDWSSLARLLPTLLAYLLSFLFVAIYWNNHHHLLLTVRRISGGTLWANLHLLFWLSLLPYVTGWAGESHFAAIPMTLYAADALMCGIAYTVLTQIILRADAANHLLNDAVGNDSKGKVSLVLYATGVIAPFYGAVGIWLSGLCLIAVALIWLIPDRRIERLLAQHQRSD